MNMYLRMIRVLLMSLMKNPLHPNRAFSSIDLKVGLRDIDAVGHLNNGKLIAICKSKCVFLENWKERITPDEMWKICNDSTFTRGWADPTQLDSLFSEPSYFDNVA